MVQTLGEQSFAKGTRSKLEIIFSRTINWNVLIVFGRRHLMK